MAKKYYRKKIGTTSINLTGISQITWIGKTIDDEIETQDRVSIVLPGRLSNNKYISHLENSIDVSVEIQ